MCVLQDEIARFKQWAPPSEHRHGEWECNYGDWDRLLAAAISTADRFAHTAIPPRVADDLLYALARDNECEHIREHLVGRPQLLSILAARAIESDDADAKWQIAVSIGEAGLEDAAELILPFLEDEDEYVRRRALMAYAPFAPHEAEILALQNLTDAYEYTRIAALHVLQMIGSPQLAPSLDALENDPSEHVKSKVRELREKGRTKPCT